MNSRTTVSLALSLLNAILGSAAPEPQWTGGVVLTPPAVFFSFLLRRRSGPRMSLHWLWSTTPPALVQLSAALASIAQFLKLVPQPTKATDNRRILFIHVLIEMLRCHNEQMLAAAHLYMGTQAEGFRASGTRSSSARRQRVK
jgi:hypothetical protein